MSFRVRALNATHVQPAHAANPPPNHAGHAIKLSLFDTLVIALTPIQRLFFYEGDGLPPFPSLSRSLQSSLAATLAVFTPLAGKLTAAAPASSGDVFIDCSPDAVSQGVRFVEAEYAGSASDMRRLAADAEHDAEAFLQLVPGLAVGELPAPVLAVQVTRPEDTDDSGGAGVVVVGVAISHTVADGQAVWQFVRAWAAVARGGSPAFVLPTFDRAVINRHPKEEDMAREFVRIFAPALPMVNMFPEPDITLQRRRTYLLGANQIRSLKQRISLQSRGAKIYEPAVVEPPTTFAAVASLVWTSVVRAKQNSSNHADNDDTYLMFAADCRARLRPQPLADAFFGNCVKSCYARATVGELLRGGGDLARAASAVREAIRQQLEDPLTDAGRWLERHRAIPRERIVQIGASHRFPAYETDFGWGAPCRVELVSVFMSEFVALVGARDGAVQVSVALDRERMDGFEASFLSMLHASE